MLATIIQTGGKLITDFLQTYGIRRPNPVSLEVSASPTSLSTEETINYQKRELAKELLLLETHLEQGCKINGRPCDCCSKHPIKIEGLAQETSGMTPEPVFKQLADWASSIAPVTGEVASASGKYDKEYPQLAMKAREFRKAIMPKEVKDGEIPTASKGAAEG